MKTSKFHTILAAAAVSVLCIPSSFATGVREGGGFGYFQPLFQCTESRPANPTDPTLVFVTEFANGIQLIVRKTSQVPPNTTPYLYNDTVVRNTTIRCLVECHLFENQKDGIQFMITKVGKAYRGMFAGKAAAGKDFVCTPAAKHY